MKNLQITPNWYHILSNGKRFISLGLVQDQGDPRYGSGSAREPPEPGTQDNGVPGFASPLGSPVVSLRFAPIGSPFTSEPCAPRTSATSASSRTSTTGNRLSPIVCSKPREPSTPARCGPRS
jgi:hypothetical protein